MWLSLLGIGLEKKTGPLENEKVREGLPSSTIATKYGVRPPFYWGMAMLILIEVVVFSSLILSYFYLRSGNAEWPIGGITLPTC
jgi:heme/copper-type cytochrome/quinol oxidase subunit 3